MNKDHIINGSTEVKQTQLWSQPIGDEADADLQTLVPTTDVRSQSGQLRKAHWAPSARHTPDWVTGMWPGYRGQVTQSSQQVVAKLTIHFLM